MYIYICYPPQTLPRSLFLYHLDYVTTPNKGLVPCNRCNQDKDAKSCGVFPVCDDTKPFESRQIPRSIVYCPLYATLSNGGILLTFLV